MARHFARILGSLAALVFFLFAPVSALADTMATVWQDTVLADSAEVSRANIGTITSGTPVLVQECRRLWCAIASDQGNGWIRINTLDFGQSGDGPLNGEEFDRKFGGPGLACLYSGANFTGKSLCGPTGYVVSDLSRAGLDNMFASATVEGNVSLMVCRDTNFHSYCVHVTEDTENLGLFLQNQVSSIRVY